MKAFLKTAAIGALMGLAACSTPAPEARVTRFHLGQPIAPGQVTIEPLDRTQAGSLEFQNSATIVGRELTRLGFTLAPGLQASDLVAVVDVRRGTREALAARSPVSIGLGGGSFGGGVGVGGGVSFPIGKARSRDVVGTELTVQLKRRSEGTVIWEGRAQTEARADTPAASQDAAVSQLATALFQGFPGESGRTITVK